MSVSMTSLKRIILTTIVIFISVTRSSSQNNSPVVNYNHFVKYLSEHYGLFPYKNINWDSLCNINSRSVTDDISPDSLFFILSSLAGNLRDKHLWIENEKYVYNYSIGKVFLTKQVDSIFFSRKMFKDKELIKSRYLNNRYNACKTNNFLSGKIVATIGYLSLDWFDSDVKKVDSAASATIKSLSDCSYLIIDIRNNTGGTDSSALTLANHFVKTGKCYQISRIRSGHQTNTYTDPVYWNTSINDLSFNKPTIVLINRYSISAAETFSLALKDQDHIKFLGEPTAGAFSDSEDACLPNGWHFTYSIGVWTDCKGDLWEEKGIQPDIRLETTDEDIANKDSYLEEALRVFGN
jgi:carboxyl-terminal processing protease